MPWFINIAMFSFFKRKPKEYSKIENHIYGIITELLKVSGTDINCDELGGKYYLSNEEQHFKVTILSNDSVIRLTNTRDSVAEKYDKFFVDDVLKAVKEEKHRRMELVYDSITNSIEKMAERLHNTLIESNEQEQFKEQDVLSKF
jgi:mevalonate kinase